MERRKNVTVDRKELKRQAREAMRLARPNPYWVALLLFVITTILGVLGMSLSGSLAAYRTMISAALEGELVYVPAVSRAGGLGRLLQIALEIMGMEMTMGFTIYTLRLWRRQEAGAGNLFDGFGMFFRALLIQIIPAFLASLWSLLYVLPVSVMVLRTFNELWLLFGLPLLIPMLMAMYAYRLAPFIMLDNPGLGCFKCVALSREMMRGHRWELFKLEMSFLGWALLCAVIPIAGLLLAIWVSAYMQVTLAGFYEAAAGRYASYYAPPVDQSEE